MPWQGCNTVHPWVCSSWVQLQASSWGSIPWPAAWLCWCRGCLVTGGGESVRAAAANCARAPEIQSCTEPSLIQKRKWWRLVLISHLWITPGSHHPIRPLRGVLDLLRLSATRRFWYTDPMNKKALAIVKKDLLSLKSRHVCKDEGNMQGPETTLWAFFMHHRGRKKIQRQSIPCKAIRTTPQCEHSYQPFASLQRTFCKCPF